MNRTFKRSAMTCPLCWRGVALSVLLLLSAPLYAQKQKGQKEQANKQPSVVVCPAAPVGEGETPLYVLDGKVVTQEVLMRIAPEDIDSISVLRGEKVPALCRGRVADGLVVIKSKADKDPQVKGRIEELLNSLETSASANPKSTQGSACSLKGKVHSVQRNKVSAPTQVKGTSGTKEISGVKETPCYIVDGKQMSPEEIKAILPEKIESIQVFAQGALLPNGQTADKSTLLITTKK